MMNAWMDGPLHNLLFREKTWERARVAYRDCRTEYSIEKMQLTMADEWNGMDGWMDQRWHDLMMGTDGWWNCAE